MRPPKSALSLSVFILMILALQPNAYAQRIDEKAYRYPYKDPYLATMTAALMQGNENPPTSQIKDLRIKILDDRDDVYLLEGMGSMHYRFYQQTGSAPLIFIVPGLAGSAYSGPARFLAEWFAGHGFHVLTLPSPFHWNFTLAASVSGYPGYTQEDSNDLYLAMQRVLDDVKSRCHAQIGKIGVLGFSDGALYAAYLSKMDNEQKRIGIDTYLLVNPPMDLFETARKIDRMADIGKEYGSNQKSKIQTYAFGVLMDAMANDTNDPDYFSDWDNRLRLKNRQMKYLIGKSFHDSVGETVYVIDLSNHMRFLKKHIDWWHRNARLEEARSYNLMDYIGTFVVPRLRQLGNQEMSLKALDKLNSIRSIKSVLENQQTVFLMHNLDDILVSEENIAYLERVFGERAIIYPHGGHLGNLWYPENKQHMLDVFTPLLQPAAQNP